jgi:hypothetical protein
VSPLIASGSHLVALRKWIVRILLFGALTVKGQGQTSFFVRGPCSIMAAVHTLIVASASLALLAESSQSCDAS